MDISGLKEGTLLITSTSTDGSESSPSMSVNLVHDTEPPAVQVVGPVAGDDVVRAQEASELIISGTGEPGAIVRVQVEDQMDRLVQFDLVKVSPAGKWSVSSSIVGLQDGLLMITATATDVAGN